MHDGNGESDEEGFSRVHGSSRKDSTSVRVGTRSVRSCIIRLHLLLDDLRGDTDVSCQTLRIGYLSRACPVSTGHGLECTTKRTLERAFLQLALWYFPKWENCTVEVLAKLEKFTRNCSEGCILKAAVSSDPRDFQGRRRHQPSYNLVEMRVECGLESTNETMLH